jgi:hypothetical protein
VKLIHAFSKAGAKIIASKDYHPDGHVSFMEQGGPFPAHCVQGSPGSQAPTRQLITISSAQVSFCLVSSRIRTSSGLLTPIAT